MTGADRGPEAPGGVAARAAGDEAPGAPAENAAGGRPGPVVAVVTDLFFVARLRETARLAGVDLVFARTPEEAEARAAGARFFIVDLTASSDHARVLAAARAAGAPVLGFTTHALARRTQPWHAACARVVTKETLTAELPTLLREGVSP